MSKKSIRLPQIISAVDKQLNSILGDDLPLLSKVKKYTVQSGGKRIRPLLTYLLASQWIPEGLNKKAQKEYRDNALALSAIPEIIHAASLLHDDVLDLAEERRGKPSGRILFGNKEVILAGDYLLACGIDRLNQFKNPALMGVFTRVLKDLSVSELLQMQYRNSSKITMEVYSRIIYGKTASLFEACTETAALFASLKPAEIKAAAMAGRSMGMLFQLRDDWLDYFDPHKLKKEPWQDYINGIITYPVLCLQKQIPAREYKQMITEVSSGNRDYKIKNAENFTAKLKSLRADQLTLNEINRHKKNVWNFLEAHGHLEESRLISEQFSKLLDL